MQAHLCTGYLHELTHGQFNKMTLGEQVGTAAAGIASAGILYEVLPNFTQLWPLLCPIGCSSRHHMQT